jgi:cytoskeletal protein CcmA (bactofilin family)
MKGRIIRGIMAVAAVALALLFIATPTFAADLRGGESVIVASGDVVNDDIYAAASRVVINGTVNGDVLAVGNDIIINGKVNGSIMAVGSNIDINGEVTRSARVAGANILVTGTVGEDLATAGSKIDIAATASIGRDVIFGASNIEVRGPVGGDVKGGASKVVLASRVQGNVELGLEPFSVSGIVDIDNRRQVSVGELIIEPTAGITGDLNYISRDEVTIPPGTVQGQVMHTMPAVRQPIIPAFSIWFKVIAFLMTLVAGIVIVVIFPRRSQAVAESIKRRPWLSLGWGALIFFLAPLAILITFVTIIGIPVGLIGLVLYALAIFVSQIVVGLFIGYLILGTFNKMESRGILVAALALGFTILTLVKLIPYLGIPLWLATVVFGIGAIAMSRRTAREMNTVETD